jgi:predicted DNA-binding transcriptional regulator AlpA
MNMIAIEAICKKGKFSVQTLHRLRRAGVFPPPRLQLSRKLIRWDEDEVDTFFRGEWVPEAK